MHPSLQSRSWLRAALACGRSSGRCVALSAVALLLAAAQSAVADEPLHVRIDQAIAKPLAGQPVAERSSDEEFLRRIYLDLAGRIPSLDEAKEFLEDSSENKRAALIDRLLNSPDYARRMQYVFDIMLMERRPASAVAENEWQEYLYASFANNKPFNELARELLSADGVEDRPPARFYLDRGGDTDILTRDVGRLFFGMDLQCAQCHDHPLIGDYHQTLYYGIYAFLNRSFVFTDAKTKKTFFAEKAEGEVAFKSVFDPSVDEKDFKPRLPGGTVIEEPTFAKDEAYIVAPAKDVRPVPKFSRREQLAKVATDGSYKPFNRNIANRLWYVMMGRGLFHPLDLDNADNPPSHPELLDMLGEEFAASGFDIKFMLRELALSETYQRSSILPEGMTTEQAAPERYAVALLKPLSAEQLAMSMMEATGMLQNQRNSKAAKVDSDPKLKDLLESDPKRQQLREEMIEKAVHAAVNSNIQQFVNLFGSPPGEPEQDFQATVHQALFFNNGGLMQSLVSAQSGNLIDRLQKMEDPQAAVETLYLAVFSRLPDETERSEAVEYLTRDPEAKQQAIQQMIWALLTSSEFRFNH